jgi:hypothetical protein
MDKKKDRNGPLPVRISQIFSGPTTQKNCRLNSSLMDHTWIPAVLLSSDQQKLRSDPMSQKEIADTLGHPEVSESSIGNLSKLAGLARQAYEQKRTKDCLDLTRTILLIDPDNADAQWLRSSVQSQIHQDLENARAFLLQAQSRDNSEAEVVPTPAEAVLTTVPPETELDSARDSIDTDSERDGVDSGSERDGIDSRVEQEPLKLVLAYSATGGAKPPWVWIACALVVLSLLSAGLVKVLAKNTRAQSLQKVTTSDGLKPVAKADTPEPGALPPTPYTEDPFPVAGRLPAAAVPPGAERHPADETTGLSSSDLSPLATTANQKLPFGAGMGTLAVSSATSVDIYEGDQYLGSSPVSLELSVGMHTLEYRHGDLRRIVTQAIYANETARAMIAFDTTVQINARPWAEVFLDGPEQKDLGQTPLSGVRVPIGSILIFQNPKFQPKRYRVTGNETGIQIVFP